MKNFLPFALVVISSTTFAQAVKPCRCPDAGAACSTDGGSFCANQVLARNNTLENVTLDVGSFGSCGFVTAIKAAYTVQVNFDNLATESYQPIGSTFGSSNGWLLYRTRVGGQLQFNNYSGGVPSILLDTNSTPNGVWQTIVISKNASDLYTFCVNGVSVATGTSSLSAARTCNNYKIGQSDATGSNSFTGKIRNAAFFSGVELSVTQCAALHAGSLTISQLSADAGMEFGLTLNHTGDDLSGNNRYAKVSGPLTFVAP